MNTIDTAPNTVAQAAGVVPTRSPGAAQQIAENLLGPIQWRDAFVGHAERCPGAHLHTHRTGSRDCMVLLDGAPTVSCFHTSCAGVIEQTNHRLRSAIGQAERGGVTGEVWAPSTADLARLAKRERTEKLKRRAKTSLAQILEEFPIAEPDLWEESPVRLDGDIKDEWRLHLQLFGPEDIVWIGNVYDSGEPKHSANFRTVSEWLKGERAPANFTSGSTYKPGSCSRSNEAVAARKFFVIESDTLSRGEMLSVIAWCQQFMRLRVIVSTGGKSLHGWFNFPEADWLAELKLILPQLQCDPALFKPAQPCRLAGAWRSEKSAFQHLLFLDLQ